MPSGVHSLAAYSLCLADSSSHDAQCMSCAMDIRVSLIERASVSTPRSMCQVAVYECIELRHDEKRADANMCCDIVSAA
jgi:hypothetical protein